jgi:transposase-like protein
MPRHRTKEERARVVQAWRSSGESAFRFAKANGVALNSLKRWASTVPEEQRFVRLEIATPETTRIAVQVGGARVIVEKGFDRALLRAVVEALS